MMKKMMLTVAMMILSLSMSFSGEGEKVRVISTSTSSVIVVFDVSSNGKDKLFVDLKGISGELPSVSLIGQNGQTFLYKFIEHTSDHLEFDLTAIEPGAYYVKLNMESEIRMKMIVIGNQ
jgi:hypothetical protein